MSRLSARLSTVLTSNMNIRKSKMTRRITDVFSAQLTLPQKAVRDGVVDYEFVIKETPPQDKSRTSKILRKSQVDDVDSFQKLKSIIEKIYTITNEPFFLGRIAGKNKPEDIWIETYSKIFEYKYGKVVVLHESLCVADTDKLLSRLVEHFKAINGLNLQENPKTIRDLSEVDPDTSGYIYMVLSNNANAQVRYKSPRFEVFRYVRVENDTRPATTVLGDAMDDMTDFRDNYCCCCICC